VKKYNYGKRKEEYVDNIVAFCDGLFVELFHNCALQKGLDGCFACEGCDAHAKWFNHRSDKLTIDEYMAYFLDLSGEVEIREVSDYHTNDGWEYMGMK
jgi:hypothetical protein